MRHFGPFAEDTWEKRALVSMETGAKDSRVGLIRASGRALWEGDSTGRGVETCVLSLLEDPEAGSPCLAGRTIERDLLRDLKRQCVLR